MLLCKPIEKQRISLEAVKERYGVSDDKGSGRTFVFLRWSQERRGSSPDTKADPNSFYSDPQCQDVFKNFLATITSRVNTITNNAYRYPSLQPIAPPFLLTSS